MEMFHGISDMALSSTLEAGIGFLVLAVLLYFLMIYNSVVALAKSDEGEGRVRGALGL